MPHPALRPEALRRLKERFSESTAMASQPAVSVASPGGARAKVVRVARRTAGGALDRIASRTAESVRAEVEDLHAQIEALSAELARARSSLEAEIALLRAEQPAHSESGKA